MFYFVCLCNYVAWCGHFLNVWCVKWYSKCDLTIKNWENRQQMFTFKFMSYPMAVTSTTLSILAIEMRNSPYNRRTTVTGIQCTTYATHKSIWVDSTSHTTSYHRSVLLLKYSILRELSQLIIYLIFNLILILNSIPMPRAIRHAISVHIQSCIIQCNIAPYFHIYFHHLDIAKSKRFASK